MMDRTGSYWDVYDIKTGELITSDYFVRKKSWPVIGEVAIGIPGRLNAVVKDSQL